MTRRGLLALVGLLLLAAAGWGVLRLTSGTALGDLRRDGPAAVVRPAQGPPQLWVIGQREEQRTGMRRAWRGNRLVHLELSGYDTVSGERRWTRRLRTLDTADGGHGARARILGPDGDRVWLFVHDQPVAVAAADGAVRATLLDIAGANPTLADLVPRQLDEYLFDDGLVFIAADGQRWRIAGPGLAAAPYEPRSANDFNERRFMAGRWHGGYETRRFLTPQSRTAQRWVGLYTDDEAREAGNDGFGDHLKEPDRTWRDDRLARRGLWTAAIGRTKAFSEGSHERLLPPLKRLAGSADYLQGGFLRDAGRPNPLPLDGDGLLVLHRTRMDEAGRAVLSRVDIGADLQPQARWQAALPFTELHSRWQWPDRLLLLGQVQALDEDGDRRTAEHLAIVDLRDGRVSARDLGPPAAAAPGR